MSKERNIMTEYRGLVGNTERVIMTTRSAYPLNATKNCFGHMQVNQYDAHVAEVYSLETGELYAVFTYDKKGELNTVFKKDPRDFVTRGTLKHFQKRAEKLKVKAA
jgi:hypothetical protein